MFSKTFTKAAILALAVFGSVMHAQAQTYPDKPIKLVVPFPPGGATDIMARLLADGLRERLGQPVIIDNRPGAGTMIASDIVAKAAPDGYTLLLAASPLVIAPSLYAKVNYDPIKDFVPITQVASIVHVLVVNPKLPATNVRELIAYLKANPGKASYGSVGAGTLTHIKAEAFQSMAGVKMAHIPYKGSAPAETDLIGGEIQLMFDSYPSASPFIRNGNVRALAIATPKRSPVAPGLPTIAESGLPGFELAPWLGVVAPAGTPAEVVARVHRETVELLKKPELQKKFLELGLEPVGSSPKEFGKLLRDDMASYSKTVKEAGIKVD
jgi:tripartite-type tricarboxylate transporter receptor subunit TctC